MIRFIFVYILIVLTFSSCQDPTKDVVLHISPDFYDYALSVQVRSLVAPNAPIEYNGTFNIGGADAAYVYTIDGTKSFRLNNGEAALMIDRLSINPSAEKPVQFELIIDLPGFKEKKQLVEVLEGEYYSEETIYLVPEDAIVEGLKFEERTLALNSNGTLNQALALDFETNSVENANRFTLALDSGVSFYDRQGNQVSGTELDLDVIGFDTYSDNSTLSLPGSSLIQMVELDGVIQKSYLGAMPRISINLSIDGQEVKSISGGKMNTRMGLRRAFNTTNASAYEIGDSLEIASFDEQDQYWKIIEQTVVKSDSNRNFYIETELDNFSQKIPSSFSRNQLPVHVNIITNGNLVTKTEYRANYDGEEKLLHSTANLKFNLKMDPSLILFARAVPDRLYLECETSAGTYSSRKDRASGQSIEIRWNDASDTITAVLQGNPNSFVGFYTARCVNQPRVLIYPPAGTKVFAKESGTENYPLAPVHIVTEENKNNLRFETPAIEDGKLYDVKISFSGNDLAERFAIRAVYGDTIDVEIPSEDCAVAGF